MPLVLLRSHYRVIKVLSKEEGFGRTYRAEDIDKMNEPCVVKQLKPQVQGIHKAVQLFKQEAQRLQQLGEHPQIPTLYAYFEENNYLYLVQQFIDGQNLLKELEQRGAFSENQIRELLLDILPVLKFVHDKKVIHQDIKPQNIIRRLSDNKLVLVDFSASQPLTATQAIQPSTKIGSLGYASYEQMKGDAASSASDLFSLGVTCFHLLSQKHPHLLFLERGYEWVPNWRQYFGYSVSNDLSEVLDKLLQKDVKARYQSADEVIRDLMTQSATVPPLVTPSISIKQILNDLIKHIRVTVYIFNKANRNLKYKLILIGIILVLGITSFKTSTHLISFLTSQTTFLLNSPSSHAFSEKTLSRHSYKVNSIAINPDGETLVSASHDKTIKVWNMKTGELIRTLTGHYYSVYCVAISPDGQTLVSGSSDKTIKVWNLKTGKLIRTLLGHSSSVDTVAISPDEQTLVSGSDDKTIKVWNLKTGKLVRTLLGHKNYVWSAAISPDGQTLVSGSDDKTIKVWNLRTGILTRTLLGHDNSVNSVAFSPDGKTVASGSWDNTIKVWNLKTGELIYTLMGHSDYVYSVAFSPDGENIASGSSDKTIKLWNLKTGELIDTMTEHDNSVNSVAFSPDGATFASASNDTTVKIWRMQ
ncbi:serine/threonine protein kinase [Trichocoleus sp. DQ-A1]|nr:serine/threonine-protein kinase [Coleofasciculus sp. FACHB-129]